MDIFASSRAHALRKDNEAFRLYLQNSTTGREQFRQVIIEAMDLMNECSELSSTCIAYLKGSGKKWITQFIK